MNFNEPEINSQDAPLWTARVQHRNSTAKPVKLIELGTGEHGKFARIGFADEVTRPIYLQVMADAWHPIFDSLTSDERWKIRAFFSPFEPEALPGGNVKTKFNLSFVTRVETKAGKFVSENNFDVPAQAYWDGALTGVKMASEYMAAISLRNFECTSLMSIVRDMATCLVAEADQELGTPKRGNVAVAFLRELECMLRFSAKHCNHQQYFSDQIAQQTLDIQAWEEKNQKKKTAFSERMREAKKAKREAVPA
ncbi:hypothetical protein [Rhodoferax ferrireducens]|uniref:hypothetical protein n=1 Tax=Rhodoferax ferrireducens TaxID=192843 RepID=UPI000E0D8ECD|nr:hypothetical protein [Rhodoferax ferrireducens]